MDTRKKNRIGAIGLAVILVGAGSYGAYAYWPVTWTKAGKILKQDLAGMDPVDVRTAIGKVDIDRLTPQQREEFGIKVRGYVDGLEREQRREFFGGGGFMGFGFGRSDTQPADPAAHNIGEIFAAARTKAVIDYAKASPEDRLKQIDKMLDDMQARRNRAGTQPGTRPGGGGRNWGGGGGGPGMGMGGPGSGGGPGGAGGTTGQRREPDRARIAEHVANRLQNGTAEERAARRLMQDDLAKRAAQRGIQMGGPGGPGGGGPR